MWVAYHVHVKHNMIVFFVQHMLDVVYLVRFIAHDRLLECKLTLSTARFARPSPWRVCSEAAYTHNECMCGEGQLTRLTK